jgi:alpha-tubulin suppressor-like RCC1 family protein
VHGRNNVGYLSNIIQVSAGRSGRHSLAVDANGYAYAWGYNKYGQCGNDVNDCNEWTPVRVHQGAQPDDADDANEYLKYIVDICAGSDQSIAVEKDDPGDPNFNGCVYTWGTNRWGDEAYEWEWITEGYGLLGTGSNANLSDTPVKVLCGQQHRDDPNQPYLNHIVAVTAGWDHCLALEKDDPYDPNIYNPTFTGRVYAWGNNGRGYGGGHYAEEWEASVGAKKIFKIPDFWLDMEAIFCFSA